MKRIICCSLVTMALAYLLVVSEPANAIEDRPAATVQFRSKVNDQAFCTGYQVFQNLFVTEARCLAAVDGKIKAIDKVDFTDEGLQEVEVFPIRRFGLNATSDNVLFLRSLVRFARDDEEGAAGATHKPANHTSGAGTLLGSGFLMVTVLVLGV
uniref:Putative conserved secreted protein n=1 Tax=Culex tarsalis TaxID=7177 RepID=A0A1Q3FTP6_CULTA